MHFAKTTLAILATGTALIAFSAGGCAQFDPAAATSCTTPPCDIYLGA